MASSHVVTSTHRQLRGGPHSEDRGVPPTAKRRAPATWVGPPWRRDPAAPLEPSDAAAQATVLTIILPEGLEPELPR